MFITTLVCGQWAASATTGLPSAWTRQPVKWGWLLCKQCRHRDCWCWWGWLCGLPRFDRDVLKADVNVLPGDPSYYCGAARLQLLNLLGEEQQVACLGRAAPPDTGTCAGAACLWWGTFCSFFVCLPSPSDQVSGNWRLPDLTVLCAHPQGKFLLVEVNLVALSFEFRLYPNLLGAAWSHL